MFFFLRGGGGVLENIRYKKIGEDFVIVVVYRL